MEYLRCSKKTFAQSQLNILSGGLIECLDEPRHAGVSTAERLTTLLAIPERVIQMDSNATAATSCS